MSQRDTDDEMDRNTRNDEMGERDAARAERTPNPEERGKWISALLAVLGLWMIIQALGVDLTASQFWSDVAVGAVLVAIGGYNYSRRADERLASTAAAMIAVLVGLWLIAAPFVIGAGTEPAETLNDIGFWNDIIVGVLVLGLGAYSAYMAREHRRATRTTAT